MAYKEDMNFICVYEIGKVVVPARTTSLSIQWRRIRYE